MTFTNNECGRDDTNYDFFGSEFRETNLLNYELPGFGALELLTNL